MGPILPTITADMSLLFWLGIPILLLFGLIRTLDVKPSRLLNDIARYTQATHAARKLVAEHVDMAVDQIIGYLNDNKTGETYLYSHFVVDAQKRQVTLIFFENMTGKAHRCQLPIGFFDRKEGARREFLDERYRPTTEWVFDDVFPSGANAHASEEKAVA